MALNLGSTFKDFLNALNTNTEDTKGIIQGTKKVKKLSFGEENETEGLNSISTEQNDNDNWSLSLKSDHDIDLLVGNRSGISIVDRDIDIFVPKGDAAIMSLRGGFIDIMGLSDEETGGGSVSISSDKARVSVGSVISIFADNDISLRTKNGATKFYNNVDFTNANVIGLSGGGGLDIYPASIKYDNEYDL